MLLMLLIITGSDLRLRFLQSLEIILEFYRFIIAILYTGCSISIDPTSRIEKLENLYFWFKSL